jgi:glyoxylase-like metal-dependent hydrolase (beta-lactamase superfamily II)
VQAPQQLADGVVRLGTPKVNWYLVADDSGVTVVDAGLSGLASQLDQGLELLGRSREDMRAFLLTHGDADHTGVAGKMQKDGDPTPIHLHSSDEYLVQGGRKKTEDPMLPMLLKPGTWSLFAHFARYGGANPPKIERTVPLPDAGTVDVPGQPRVIGTPGHTEGHVVFHFPQHGALFVGDTICTWHPITGERGPRQMAFNVSNKTALDSLSNYEELDADLVLVGHGEPWTEGPRAAVERARQAAGANS